MTLSASLKTQIFVAGCITATLLPGAWTLVSAPLSNLSVDVISGAAQRQYEERFDDNFPLRKSFSQTWAAFKFGVFGEVAEGALVGKDGVLFTAEEFEEPQEYHDFESTLENVRFQVEQSGAELIPLIVPDKIRMMPEAFPHSRSDHFDTRYDTLLNVIAAEGLLTIDLRPSLTETGSYMVTDTHWSPSGAEAVAKQISELLQGKVETEVAFVTQQKGQRAFDGDLLAFADTGLWRERFGPTQEYITVFETSKSTDTDLGLFDDVETPITLVGTSFSARKDFHFVGFLKSNLRADVISYATEGNGPFVPMEQFLAGDKLSNPTQFVLWEIPERYLNTWRNHQ